jgi:DnaK suppressor protein
MNTAAALTDEQRAELVGRLRTHRAELARRVDVRLHGHDDDRHAEAGLPKRSDETDDDGAAEAARMADVHALSRIARELDEVEAALQRVADGSYGECIDCGDPIGAERLGAYPTALRCASCQEYVETHRGRPRPRRG